MTTTKAKINLFRGHYECFSNFSEHWVLFEGRWYRHSESAFQAGKTLDLEARKDFANLDAKTAKLMGRLVKLRPDWEAGANVVVMKTVVEDKFSRNLDIQDVLLNTRDVELEEGNWWHDVIWGVCYGELAGHCCRHSPHEPIGNNWLGKILMSTRAMLQGRIRGAWPDFCMQRAFLDGAKWWEFTKTAGTMWASDQDKAADAAIEAYGNVAIPPFPPGYQQGNKIIAIHETAKRFEKEREDKNG